MTAIVPAYLRGTAAEVWSDLDSCVQHACPLMKCAMLKKLSSDHVSIQFSQLLRRCSQEYNETVAVFARRIQKLVQKAFPEIDAKAKDSIALSNFLCGLRIDLKRLTLTCAPQTFDAAITKASEQEYYATLEGEGVSVPKWVNCRTLFKSIDIDSIYLYVVPGHFLVRANEIAMVLHWSIDQSISITNEVISHQ